MYHSPEVSPYTKGTSFESFRHQPLSINNKKRKRTDLKSSTKTSTSLGMNLSRKNSAKVMNEGMPKPGSVQNMQKFMKKVGKMISQIKQVAEEG